MSLTTRVLSIALAGTVLAPVAAAAQSPATFGVKGGVNIAKINFDNDSDNEDVGNLVGAVAGVFVGKSLSDSIGFRLEGLLSQKGAKDKESGEDAKNKLTYVDVPVLLTFGPSSSTDTRFNLFTGPQVSFNTAAKFTESGQPDVDFKDEVKSTDVGWVLGAGLEKGRITADARYTLGLTNIAKNSSSKVKNRVFAVMLGVKLK